MVDSAAIGYGDLLTLVLPDARPIVAGVIEEQSGGILAGPPSVGKTWLALSLSRAVASGTDWLGHFVTTAGPVLVIDEESHLPGLQQRLRMLEAGDPLGHELPLHFAVGHAVRLDANPGAAHLDTLIARHRPRLVILDSLTRVHGANENDAGQMADVFANARAIMRRHDTALLFLDHVRKKSLVNDPEEMLRGSTEKRAWPECILFAAPADKRTLTITHVKARFTERVPDFTVSIDVDREAGTATVRHAGAPVGQQEAKAGDLIGAIHALQAELGPDGADATTVAAWLECSPDTVRRHVGRLIKAGIVASRPVRTGGRNKETFHVTGGDS